MRVAKSCLQRKSKRNTAATSIQVIPGKRKLQAELMFAPGNEHLASRSAKGGKYPELAAAQLEASNATPLSEWVAGGTSPMSVLTCLQDLVPVPENGLNLAKERPDTWLVGIPGCGHNTVFERPEALTRLIIEFIKSVVGVAAASPTNHSRAVADAIYLDVLRKG